MASKNQSTGIACVHYVGAELSRRGYAVAVTARNTEGIDLMATAPGSLRSYAIQVKGNARRTSFWLLGEGYKPFSQPTFFYTFVNLLNDGTRAEFFIVPSRVVARRYTGGRRKPRWPAFRRVDAERYRDRWDLLK